MRLQSRARASWLLPRVLALASVLAFGSGSRGAEPPPAEPRDAVASFYRSVLAASRGGVPDEKDRARLAPHLSPSLDELLAQADAAEREYHDATRGEVPPLVEGDLFSSLFEGPTAFGVGSCETSGATASCEVELRYEPPGDSAKTRWKDRVLLVQGDRGWLVDDVAYGGDWEFMHKGTLRGVLASAIRDGRAEAAVARKEGLLLGGWVHATGDTDFEQMAFAIEDGRYVFRSWLHERPEIVGTWSREGDTVTIRGPDDASWKLAVLAADESTLEVRFDGRAEKAVFRRPKEERSVR